MRVLLTIGTLYLLYVAVKSAKEFFKEMNK